MSGALSRIAQVAMHNFQRNADTLVAGFLVRNPDIDPADVELVMSSTGGNMRFSIEPKELHVPAEIPEDDCRDVFYKDGWNDCRQAMIDGAKKARPADAMVATLDSMVENLVGGLDG